MVPGISMTGIQKMPLPRCPWERGLAKSDRRSMEGPPIGRFLAAAAGSASWKLPAQPAPALSGGQIGPIGGPSRTVGQNRWTAGVDLDQ